MSDKLTKWVVGNAVVTVIILLILILRGFGGGGSSTPVTGSVTSLGNGISHFLAVEVNELIEGTDTANLTQITITGNCPTGGTASASTTLFAINPYYGIATSTIDYFQISGIQGATSTDIAIGTSTSITATSTFATGIKENYLYLSTIATSSNFFANADQTLYSQNISTTTNVYGTKVVQAPSITVGPNEYFIGYSTSTWIGGDLAPLATSSGYAVPQSCTYKVTFNK